MAKKQLALYRAKRDFERTAEPKGEAVVKAAEYPRFVIQKHAATRLHYDLRLEIDGVFKSWAVTRGPSLDPADKRLAVEVEDHPLDYGDFEGTIPKGQYGGGTVMLWDRGFWLPEGDQRADEALRKGELKFVLAGEKLKGSWVLVRIRRDRDRGNRNNWLLIKHRDEFAVDDGGASVLANDKSVASGRTMEEIAAGKGSGPKPFMTAGGKAPDPAAIWNSNRGEAENASAALERQKPKQTPEVVSSRKSSPKSVTRRKRSAAMPEFIVPQLCKSVTRPPSGADWVHEIKFDGYRLQLRIEDGKAVLRTRKALDWTGRFAAIARAATGLPDAIIDGEAVALDRNGLPDFPALQVALSEGRSQDLIYFAFDLLYADGQDLRGLPLSERKQRLKQLLAGAGMSNGGGIRYVEHLPGDGDAVLKSACNMHLEGIVSKCLTAPYVSARADTWTKSKCRAGQEVVIGGWTGGATKLRSLIVGVYRADQFVHVGRVGTGFNSGNSKTLLKKLTAIASDTSPFGGRGAPRRAADCTWVRPELVAEIEFAGWTGAGMVRQAAFKSLREDKPAKEVIAEQSEPVDRSRLAKIEPSGASVRGGTVATSGSTVMGITISNPGKVLWPPSEGAQAVTKLDLARYLEAVGPWMIDHIQGRPCSVIRAPDGIESKMFFQRHVIRGQSDLLTLTTVSGDREPYVQIDSVEALIAMAQSAAVEFHPWNCQPGHVDVPGRLIFDLDPGPDVEFGSVVSAAREMKERLERCGLVAFCKTTGGKGLHVVTPLKMAKGEQLGWDDAKTFAQAICAAMAANSPDRYLVNMAKRLRKSRIYLDYLRNDRMSTAVAPLSPRARDGAIVSMPLNWSGVRSDLDPRRYTIWTAAALLVRNKTWREYRDSARPLSEAIKALVRATH